MRTSEKEDSENNLLNSDRLIFDPSILNGIFTPSETNPVIDYGIYSAPSDSLSIGAIQSNNSDALASHDDLENFITLCDARCMAFEEEYLSDKELSKKIDSLSSFMDMEHTSYKKIIQALGNFNGPNQEIAFRYFAKLSLEMIQLCFPLLWRQLAAENLRAYLTSFASHAINLSEHQLKYLGLMYAHLAAGNRLPLPERAEPGAQQPHAIAGMNVGYR